MLGFVLRSFELTLMAPLYGFLGFSSCWGWLNRRVADLVNSLKIPPLDEVMVDGLGSGGGCTSLTAGGLGAEEEEASVTDDSCPESEVERFRTASSTGTEPSRSVLLLLAQESPTSLLS